MTRAVKAMLDLGFIDTTDKHDGVIVRQFKKINRLGYITDSINFIANRRNEIDVFTNDLINACGSRLDTDLLKAIDLNLDELYRNFKNEMRIKE